jgi:virulence factor Mce-like protein
VKRRRGNASLAASPVLVGSVTTLVVIVAVFLAYNANNGLPFVPTHEYKVQLDSGSNLVRGNDVRAGGFRIGAVQDLKPVTLASGKTVAVLTLKLDKSTGAVPADSTVTVRPRSALGLKYVELTKGHSKNLLRDGDTIQLARTATQVQLDDLNKLFDRRTRRAAQDNLVGFGNAFTGRGQDLNATIAQLPVLLGYLQPVAGNLASSDTQLGRFFRELGNVARIVAPVAGVNARLFTDMGTTFEAIARDPAALRATISKSPSTLDVSTTSLRAQRPFLDDTAKFSHDLRSATHELRGALPDINPALETGTPVLRRSVDTSQRLKGAFGALRDLVRAPTTNTALRGLVGTVTTLNPQLRFLGPFQTVCDYFTYFWTFNAEHFSESATGGSAERALLNSQAVQDNSSSTDGAVEAANGEGYQAATAARGDKDIFHGQSYDAAVNDNGSADCETGQRGYLHGPLSTFGPKTDLEGNPNLGVTDAHTPGSQGPTYHGLPGVPPGETFTREPGGNAAQLAPELTTGIYAGR